MRERNLHPSHSLGAQRRREQRRRDQAQLEEFRSAVRAGDVERCRLALLALEHTLFGWRRAMRAVANTPAPEEFRSWFLHVWVDHGDHLRSEVDDDRVLMDALWMLLPRYSGQAITLYRGDSFWNRRRRTYGLSWTDDPDVARAFACGLYRTFQGGSVLLKTTAPAKAVICAPALLDGSRPAEREYLIDRRQLGGVEVVERFAQEVP